MRLRNKKTGEVEYISIEGIDVSSISKLANEWEDCEEELLGGTITIDWKDRLVHVEGCDYACWPAINFDDFIRVADYISGRTNKFCESEEEE